ncbi:MAG TPA: hypothetical protein PKY77_08485 [Phycisphaerae bacterium]|nr:hypothetical protein [Phycisphaerae bacterium]HRY68730.1 hypothetical protein [Phycisphaerae bacterium]HSA29547.1 hypothetical protein [Phycisphaerae bacterium]
MTTLRRSLLGSACLLLWTASAGGGVTYFVAGDGSDSADGRSETTAWRTLEQVNAAALRAGDRVLFRRGDSWRGQLRPRSGNPSARVLYGAYGTGAKPVLMGSASKSSQSDWHKQSEHIWVTTDPATTGPELLATGAARDPAPAWHTHTEGGAAIEGGTSGDGPGTAFRIQCSKPGQKASDIQLYTCPIPLRRGSMYLLRFRARSTRPLGLAAPALMQQGPPWASYGSDRDRGTAQIGDSWLAVRHYYVASQNATDGRLTFFLGGVLPAGATLLLDRFSFVEVDGTGALRSDVGNIIFDGGGSCGRKVWQEADLKAQGDYWYDREQCRVKMYSAAPPASQYRTIECALRPHIIDQSNVSWVVYENLALKYGGAHGIGGASTHHIVVRDCDFSFIGGADQHGDGRKVRFGNGIEFWAGAHDHLVERCRLWEVYDAALTNQNDGANAVQANITYRHNLIWNCEYSFEYWNRPDSSRTKDIVFEHNTCVNAGAGWGHAQRPDPSGRHLCFYSSPAPAERIRIRNNIFFLAEGNAFYAPGWPEAAVKALDMDYNCWYQPKGVMMAVAGQKYRIADFAEYQARLQLEPHSMAADPRLKDVARQDFRLREDSPCLGTAHNLEERQDSQKEQSSPGQAAHIGAQPE